MIHLFESLGKRMALDVGSGAVLSLDPIAYDALKLLVEDADADVAAAHGCRAHGYPASVFAGQLNQRRIRVRVGDVFQNKFILKSALFCDFKTVADS